MPERVVVEMERKEGRNIRLNELPGNPLYELKRCGAGNALFDKELKAYQRLFEEDDVMDDSYKILFMCLFVEEERFESQTKRRGKEGANHLIEYGGVRKNGGKALKERLGPNKKRKDRDRLIEHDGVHENSGEENDPEDKLFLKHLKELGKPYAVEYKKDSINVVIKYRKDIGSHKDCEMEPRRKSSRMIKRNLWIPNQVPNVETPRENDQKAKSVKSSRTGRKSSNEDEKVEIEKFSPSVMRNVFMKKSRDEDEKVEIKKCPPRELRSVVMKRLRNEAEKAEIEKCPVRDFRNVVMKKSRDDYEKVEIEKFPSRELRNAIMKKSRNEYEKVEIEKCPGRELRDVVMKKSRNEDEKVEIEKCSARDYRNAAMKKPRNEAEIEKLLAPDFRNVRGASKSSMPCKDINKNDAEEESEDSDVEILDMNAACLKGPFVASKKFGKNVEVNGPRSSDSSDEFRRQVLEVLTKPYAKDEYIVLKTEFEARYYTDYHPDLGSKLKKYRYNQRKRLAILCGFFFWIQNLTREGAFKPWKDGVCLAVEPQSPETNPGNKFGS